MDHFYASDGTEIIVGKNNKQNDYLTNRFAARDEIWLHTKDIPGSHVVIRSKEPSEKTIREAAILAAYYSKARHSSSVPVDFTHVSVMLKNQQEQNQDLLYMRINRQFMLRQMKNWSYN